MTWALWTTVQLSRMDDGEGVEWLQKKVSSFGQWLIFRTTTNRCGATTTTNTLTVQPYRREIPWSVSCGKTSCRTSVSLAVFRTWLQVLPYFLRFVLSRIEEYRLSPSIIRKNLWIECGWMCAGTQNIGRHWKFGKDGSSLGQWSKIWFAPLEHNFLFLKFWNRAIIAPRSSHTSFRLQSGVNTRQ